MFDDEKPDRDLAALSVPLAGGLEETGSRWEPCRLLDPAGEPVRAAAEFFVDLQARGWSQATVRSYGKDLLRWFRFCWVTSTPWDRATRAEARDFCRWMLIAGKPSRPHWRAAEQPQAAVSSGKAYAPSVRAHCETVLRSFYDYHLEAGTAPIVNPFPLDRSRRGGRANAHHSPMEPFRKEKAGRYRPRVPFRVPRSVPDEEFNEIFARLPSHRDRALVAFYVSTGARAPELLSATQGGTDPGRQLIAVIRKGSGELQELPASTDAFVWLRPYQVEMEELIPRGRRQPLWWTLRTRPCPRWPPGGLSTARRSSWRPRTAFVSDITTGDVLEVLDAEGEAHGTGIGATHLFYRILHEMGVFGPGAPATLRELRTGGQRTPAGLIDRYQLACRPVRDLLVEYLQEPQPALDCSSLDALAHMLGRLFWADLERHHPGIGSLRLPDGAATAWKQRLRTVTKAVRGADGTPAEVSVPRVSCLTPVRAFYMPAFPTSRAGPRLIGPSRRTHRDPDNRGLACLRQRHSHGRGGRQPAERLRELDAPR